MDQMPSRLESEQVPPLRPRETGDLSPDPAIVDPAEHNVVFTSLVKGDDDIVGLVAYSIYKQNKYDWLQAYGRFQGRMPEPPEVHSYLLGESTPRRLATYRHLAQAVLDGRGAQVAGSAAEPARVGTGRAPGAPASRLGLTPGPSNFQLSARAIVGLSVALLVLLMLFWYLHGSAPMPPTTPAR